MHCTLRLRNNLISYITQLFSQKIHTHSHYNIHTHSGAGGSPTTATPTREDSPFKSDVSLQEHQGSLAARQKRHDGLQVNILFRDNLSREKHHEFLRTLTAFASDAPTQAPCSYVSQNTQFPQERCISSGIQCSISISMCLLGHVFPSILTCSLRDKKRFLSRSARPKA